MIFQDAALSKLENPHNLTHKSINLISKSFYLTFKKQNHIFDMHKIKNT